MTDEASANNTMNRISEGLMHLTQAFKTLIWINFWLWLTIILLSFSAYNSRLPEGSQASAFFILASVLPSLSLLAVTIHFFANLSDSIEAFRKGANISTNTNIKSEKFRVVEVKDNVFSITHFNGEAPAGRCDSGSFIIQVKNIPQEFLTPTVIDILAKQKLKDLPPVVNFLDLIKFACEFTENAKNVLK
jgi:hypothetical protein